jgi:DNA modification methylase
MINLLHGDCLELMKTIPDNSIDMVLTSPPYDSLRTYNNSSTWNFEIFQDIAKELNRIIKKGGVIVWVVGDATVKGSETGSSFRQALYFKEIGLRLHDTMIYKKTGVMPSKNRYCQMFEYMFVLSKGKPVTTNLLRDRKNKWCGKSAHAYTRQRDGSINKRKGIIINEFGLRHNIWEIHAGCSMGAKSKKERIHPATFPIRLALDHLNTWSNEGDTVLDCFMGSGTTGLASKNLGRKFIGIEIDEQYFNIAKERIEQC